MRSVHLVMLLASLSVPAPVALAAPAAEASAAPMELVVVDDAFSRWDGTRWRLNTQVTLPFPATLYAEQSYELQFVAFDLRLVMHCDVGDALWPGRKDVECTFEDVALNVAPWLADPGPHAQAVLDETDARLTGLVVRLQATADGKVEGVKLVGEPERNRRTTILYENLRQIAAVALHGFHLVAPDPFVLGQQWVEKNSALFDLPSFRFVPGTTFQGRGSVPVQDVAGAGDLSAPTGVDGLSDRTSQIQAVSDATASGVGANRARNAWDGVAATRALGFSAVAHRMDAYRGQYVVQSKGEGTVDLGAAIPLTFRGTVDAVSVFRPEDAVMTERVWSVQMHPTAGSALAQGVAGWPYLDQGNLEMLAPGVHSEVGPSTLVAAPGGAARGNLPPWPSL